MNPIYGYASEKVTAARSALMAPHPKGEAASFASADFECSLGLKGLSDEHLDDSARGWVATIREVMSTEGIADPTGRGTATIRAEQLSIDERQAYSTAVEELAYWLHARAHGESA